MAGREEARAGSCEERGAGVDDGCRVLPARGVPSVCDLGEVRVWLRARTVLRPRAMHGEGRMSAPDHSSLECRIQVPNVCEVPYPASLSLRGFSLRGHCGSRL